MPSSRTNITIRLTDEKREKLAYHSKRLGISKASMLEEWCNAGLNELANPPKPRRAAKPVVAPAGKTGTAAVKKRRDKVTKAA